MRNNIPGIAVVLLMIISTPAWSEKKGPSKADLEEACAASVSVCHAACKRKADEGSQVSETFCKNDCDEIFDQCLSSIPLKAKKDKTGLDKKSILQNKEAE